MIDFIKRVRRPSLASLISLLTAGLIAIVSIWGVVVSARFATVNKIWLDYDTKANAAYEVYADISHHLGYGGFIHHFKNFVLRRDERYVAKIDQELRVLFATLDRLDTLLVTPEDHADVARLRATIMEYEAKYELAKRMVAAGATPQEIDKVVKVDDSPALRARASLLRHIINHRERARIASAQALASAENLFFLGLLFLLPVLGVAWLIRYFLRRVEASVQEVKAAQDQTELLLETAPDPMLAVDANGRIRRANSMAVSYYGYPRETLLHMPLETLLPERFRAGHGALREGFLQAPTHRNMGRGRSLKTLLASGEERDVAISLSHFSIGDETLATVVLRDLTEQKKAEDELHLAASVFKHSAECVMVTNAEGIIVSVNPAFTALTGYSEAEALGHNPSMIRSDRHDANFYQAIWRALGETGIWQGEIWNRKKSGEAFLEWLTINRIDDSEGNPVRYAAVFHDITELRRKDEHIRHLAFHDALTGLPNRALLHERLQHGIELALRERTGLILMFLDLDRFKAVNDTLGHDVGDLLLQNVAERIKGGLRASDTLARLGGDEFVVLMEDMRDPDIGARLAEKIIEAVSQPVELRGHRVQVGTSVGIAAFPRDGEDAQTLMKNADMAMYVAKSSGRNTYRVFQQDMTATTGP